MPLHDSTYDPSVFRDIAAVEDRHFWFQARRTTIQRLVLSCLLDSKSPTRILEIGCGTGNILSALETLNPRGLVVGMDYYDDGFRVVRDRLVNARLVQGDIFRPPFGAVFELVGLFDVLEHLQDDRAALANTHALLAPGGSVIITVPAHPSLWSYSDVIAHHERRYTKSELHDKLVETGFIVEFLSPFLSVVLPLAWLGRIVYRRRSAGADLSEEQKLDLFRRELRVIPGINGLLSGLLRLESLPIGRRRALPFGSSIIAVARKQ